MQYMFWQVVVIGGMLTNKPLSVKLLTNSLILFGKETSDLLLEDDKWNLKIEIIDTYDFTDFKSINEYMDNKEARIDDIISTTLNNFAVVSSEYGVIKIYDVKIKLEKTII